METVQLGSEKTVTVKTEIVSEISILRTESDPTKKTITALLRVGNSSMRLVLWSGVDFDSKNGSCTVDQAKAQIITLLS